MIRFLIAALFTCLALNSCYYDSEEYMYPVIGCDSTNVTYSNTIAPLLNNLCVGCHSSASTIKLNNYENVKIQADNGKLLGSINHLNGYQAMPQGGAKLDECTLKKFSKWVSDGAPNN